MKTVWEQLRRRLFCERRCASHAWKDGRNEGQGLLTVSSGYPSLHVQENRFICQHYLTALLMKSVWTLHMWIVRPYSRWLMTTRDFRSLNQCHIRLLVLSSPSSVDQLFSTFGASRVVKSDNDPSFHGEEFTKSACVLGFKHREVTPLWPRAN